MKPHWVLAPKPDQAQTLARELGLPVAITSILLQRGYRTPESIQRFLNPSLDHLESPFAFSDMKKAVERIQQSIQDKEKILIYGDYDVDGITGSAILYPVLKKLGADVDVHIPHRITEGYGLNQEILATLLKKKYKLVITVDNGISGVSQIAFLKEKGVPTIIIDHHLPKDQFPDAYAIVSACAGEKTGDDGLAACGLAFKVAWALTGSIEEVREHLDLVVVGTVADIAKVTGENRIFMKFGLPVLLKTKKPGLRALMDVAKIPRHVITYRDIAFGLGPRINASGRMGSPENAFKLLTTDNPLLAQNLANILDEGNKDRQRTELAAFEQAIERVELESMKDTEKVLVLESPEWHEGVLGIVASRLVERYRKPSIVISTRGGKGKGSGRSLGSFSLFDTVLQCEDLLDNFGGHAQACGLTIKAENIAGFRKKLNQIAATQEALPTADRMLVDGELQLSEITPDFLKALDKLSPYGPGNKKPLFLSRQLSLRGEPKKLGQDTLQAWVTDPEKKTTLEMIGFRSYSRWKADIKNPRFDLIYEPGLKDFNGITSIQLGLEDWV